MKNNFHTSFFFTFTLFFYFLVVINTPYIYTHTFNTKFFKKKCKNYSSFFSIAPKNIGVMNFLLPPIESFEQKSLKYQQKQPPLYPFHNIKVNSPALSLSPSYILSLYIHLSPHPPLISLPPSPSSLSL